MHRRDLFKSAFGMAAGAAIARFGIDEVKADSPAPQTQHLRAVGMKQGTPVYDLFPSKLDVQGKIVTSNGNITAGSVLTQSNATVTYGLEPTAGVGSLSSVEYLPVFKEITIGDTKIRSHEDGGIEFIQNGVTSLRINEPQGDVPIGNLVEVQNAQKFILGDINTSGAYHEYVEGERNPDGSIIH